MKPSEAYLSALLKGNRAECLQIVKHFLASNSSLPDLYEEVMKPALYEVGRMWEVNKGSTFSFTLPLPIL